MKLSKLSLLALTGLVLGLGSTLANAQTLNAIDRGWFNSIEERSMGGDRPNYIAGSIEGVEFRNYFVFDLTGINSMITDATLNLFSPEFGFNSPFDPETYLLTDTAPTTPADLMGNDVGSIFDTLGTNTFFGSTQVGSANAGQSVSISLNAAGLSYLNANLGQKVAFGGRLSLFEESAPGFGPAADRWAFGQSHGPGNPTTLTLRQSPNLTPEVPGIVQVIPVLLAVGAMALYKRRKTATQS
jgi:hypothetical protein